MEHPASAGWNGLLSHLPPFRGKMRLLNSAAALTRWFGADERAVQLWPKAPFHVNLNDRIQREMWAGCYEPHISRCLSLLLRRGDVFLDVGAHIGYHSYFASGVVGQGGCVHAFEPDPALFQRLASNLSTFSWAHANELAVWDRDTHLEFERSCVSTESGWGTLTAVRDLRQGEHVCVLALSLDSWNARVCLPGLNVIKIDAEGTELRVLRGARSLLQHFRPVIFIELNDVLLHQSGSSAAEVMAELSRLNYQLYFIEYSRVRPLSEISEFQFADTIALPQERASELIRALQRR